MSVLNQYNNNNLYMPDSLRVANKSATSWQLPRLLGSYEEACLMDFGHKKAASSCRIADIVTAIGCVMFLIYTCHRANSQCRLRL